MFQQDWFMRQIESLVQFVARLIFHRDAVEYELQDKTRMTQTDLLYARLLELTDEGLFSEAEDYLFEHYDPENRDHLLLALDFYQRLNSLSDEELENQGFPREEIDAGLRDILRINQIHIEA